MEYGVWSREYGVWSMEYGVWSMEYGVWSMEYGVWSMEYGVWSMEYGVWSMEFPNYKLLTTKVAFSNFFIAKSIKLGLENKLFFLSLQLSILRVTSSIVLTFFSEII